MIFLFEDRLDRYFMSYLMTLWDNFTLHTTFQTFLDNFQAAKDKMSEAGSAVAESAVEAAQQFQQRASRVGLRIQLKAPLILIPQNSTSHNALLVDLGNISVTNTFSVGSEVDGQGLPAVLDNMNIQLTDLKLARWDDHLYSTVLIQWFFLLKIIVNNKVFRCK